VNEQGKLFLVGISHKSAPVAVRERVALTAETLRETLIHLRQAEGVAEAMVISTCNRVEVYLVAETPEPARRLFLDRSTESNAHLYQRDDSEAVRHLFRVASSLDSMVVGEQQILGQVKEAYGVSSALQAAGPLLSRLCNKAFAVAKRIRSETDIGKGSTSVSQVAVELVEKIFGDLRGRAILLVGAGEMGALAAKALASLGADGILVVNRSAARAAELASEVGGLAHPWEELESLLTRADVVLVSTGALDYVVSRDLVGRAMKARKQRSICLIDLSVPRNVDPGCGQLDNVYSYDIDDLQKVVSRTWSTRAEEAIHAEALIEAEVMAFARDRDTRAALPVLAALRRQAEEIARAEAERTLQVIGAGLDEKGRRSVEAMGRAIVNKLLHVPTTRLKEAARSGGSSLAGATAELFGLESESAEGAKPREPAEGMEQRQRTEAAALPEQNR
jgi:glutamyl-tRNA reductase